LADNDSNRDYFRGAWNNLTLTGAQVISRLREGAAGNYRERGEEFREASAIFSGRDWSQGVRGDVSARAGKPNRGEKKTLTLWRRGGPLFGGDPSPGTQVAKPWWTGADSGVQNFRTAIRSTVTTMAGWRDRAEHGKDGPVQRQAERRRRIQIGCFQDAGVYHIERANASKIGGRLPLTAGRVPPPDGAS